MTMRTNSKTIVFMRPFTLAGFTGMQPAGSYLVEAGTPKGPPGDSAGPTGERPSTVSRLHPQPGANTAAESGTHPGTHQRATVCPTELAAALLQDGAAWALRFETPVQREHRGAMKIVRDTMASDRIAKPGAVDPGTDR